MSGRPFRFGIQASAPAPGSGEPWPALARRIEDLGFDVLTVADHLDDQYAVIPAMQAAADATTTLRIGALVLCNDYRNPLIAAKELATIDVLSGGRVEAGLGAGWMVSDYEQSGIRLDRPGARIDRMVAALDVWERFWESGHPTPVQRPRPPLLIGGGGRRVLSIAAQRADIVGVNVALAKGVIDADAGTDGTPARTDEKLAWIRAAAGDRFDDLELQVRVHLVVPTDDRSGAAEAIGPAFGLSPADALATPHALVGSAEEIVEDLLARRERWGISYITVSLDAADAMAPVVAKLRGT